MSGSDITLPAAALRSSAIALLGSGIGSIPFDRLVAVVGEVLKAAGSGGFDITTTPVPLCDVGKAWAETKSEERVVFTL